jgi:Leucine-rich repeat (LRR) protein
MMYLNGNKFTNCVAKRSEMKALRRFSINENRIRAFNWALVEGMPSLQLLNVEGNEISSLEPFACPALLWLYVADNPFAENYEMLERVSQMNPSCRIHVKGVH